MYNTMNTIYPRPYPQRGTGNYNAGNESTDKDGHNSQGQERQNQNQNPNQNRQTVARGRVPQQPQQNVATRPATYSPARQAYPQANSAMLQSYQMNPQQYHAMPAGYQPMPQANHQPAPQGNHQPAPNMSGPLGAKNNRVNIAQILRDFRNTMKAISTPADIEENVNKYLQIVEEQVVQPKPQINIVQSNLKIAASLLDKYISETLHKESKVVQNWLDALFLQRINYNYNEQEVNPNFLVNFNGNNNSEQQAVTETPTETVPQEVSEPEQEIVTEHEIQEYEESKTLETEYSVAQEKISQKPNITIIPQDTRLKSLFMEAKKQAFSNNPQKAMSIFKEAFNRAGELKDSETQSRICLEIGKIYDDNDFVVQALTSYYKSLQYTTDTNVKSKAHYSMAQIYDDVNQVNAALEHYITSISYAGKSDDTLTQTESLTRIANIYTDKYDDYNAFDYYDTARKLVEQTSDSNMKGYVLSNTADACVQFRKNDKALKYYAEAVKNYEQINASEEIAENYKSAGELMISFNSPNKAKSLLKKALVNAVKTSNEDLISEINLLLASVNEE